MRRVERYAIKKEKDCFDIEQLNGFVERLDVNYELQLIDEKIYNACKNYDWSVDFVQGYKSYDEYRNYGLGVVALYDGEMVAGASS